MTAQEIRAALREGSVDPFDQVSEEDSHIKLELVEVDEIFSQEDEKVESNSTVLEPGPNKTEFKKVSVPQNKVVAESEVNSSPTKPVAPSAKPSNPVSPNSTNAKAVIKKDVAPVEAVAIKEMPKPMEEAVDPEPTTTGQNERIKHKLYFLIDNNKKELGPVSADDIQSLYRRGILNDSVKVRKGKYAKKISIRQFITAYSGKRIKALHGKAGTMKKANPSSKVLNELYHLINSQKLAQRKELVSGLSIAVVGILLGLSLFFFMDFRSSNSRSGKVRGGGQESVQKASSSRRKVKKARLKKAVSPKRVNRKKPAQAKSRKARPKLTKKPKPKRTVKRSATKKSSATKVRRPAARKGPVALATAKVGQASVIGPLSYSLKELEDCPTRCRLKFIDSQGGVVTGVFFKGAYYEDLAERKSGVTISGSTKLEGSNLVIFIQDVR